MAGGGARRISVEEIGDVHTQGGAGAAAMRQLAFTSAVVKESMRPEGDMLVSE